MNEESTDDALQELQDHIQKMEEAAAAAASSTTAQKPRRRGTVSELVHSGSQRFNKRFNKEGRKSFSEWTQKSKEATRLSIKFKSSRRTRHLSHCGSSTSTPPPPCPQSRESLMVDVVNEHQQSNGSLVDGGSQPDCHHHESCDNNIDVSGCGDPEVELPPPLTTTSRLSKVLYPQYRQQPEVAAVTPLVSNFYERETAAAAAVTTVTSRRIPVVISAAAAAAANPVLNVTLQQDKRKQMNQLIFRNCGHDSPSQLSLIHI